MTEDETVRREGKRSNNFPNRVGWLGYWLRTYSSRAHWDFSCKLSTWATSDRPQASIRNGEIIKCLLHQLYTWTIHLQNDKAHYSITHTISLNIAITSVYTHCTSQYPIACSLTNAMHKTSLSENIRVNFSFYVQIHTRYINRLYAAVLLV